MQYLTDDELAPIHQAWVSAGRPEEPVGGSLISLLQMYDEILHREQERAARAAMSKDERRLIERAEFRARRGGVLTDTPCDAKCRMAMHDTCQCSCAGENHGVDFDAAVISEMEQGR